MSLDILLSEEDLNPFNWCNPATFICLSQTRNRISNVIFVCVQWREVVDPFVDDIVYHHCLNLLFYAKVVLAYHICGHILWLLLLFYYYYTYNTIVFAGHRKTAYSKKQYPNSEYVISITPTTHILYYVLQDIIQIIILLLTCDKNYALIFRFWFKVG